MHKARSTHFASLPRSVIQGSFVCSSICCSKSMLIHVDSIFDIAFLVGLPVAVELSADQDASEDL